MTSSTGDIYKLSGDGNEVVINGFVLKTADWDKVTAGQTAEIFGNGQSAFLENAGNSSFWENIKFNGKQMFGEDFGLTGMPPPQKKTKKNNCTVLWIRV